MSSVMSIEDWVLQQRKEFWKSFLHVLKVGRGLAIWTARVLVVADSRGSTKRQFHKI